CLFFQFICPPCIQESCIFSGHVLFTEHQARLLHSHFRTQSYHQKHLHSYLVSSCVVWVFLRRSMCFLFRPPRVAFTHPFLHTQHDSSTNMNLRRTTCACCLGLQQVGV
ncbi:unnamed protein product, partial [Pylaiella littoralis]